MSLDTATSVTASPGGLAPPAHDRVTAATVSPAPLAFGAFAGTTFLLSWVNAGQIHQPALASAVATSWVFGGLIQMAVAFWHLRNNELFPAVAFGSFGAFWASFGLFATLYVDKLPPGDRGTSTALFLFPWAVFSLYMLIAAFRTNVAIVIAFVAVEVTLIPLIYGNAKGNEAVIHFGGWAGVVLAAIVWYVAAAELLNQMFTRTVLPLGHLN